MKGAAIFVLTALFICSVAGCSLSGEKSPGKNDRYELVWFDEFNGGGIPDPDKWEFQTGGHGWGNREWQFYLDGVNNAVQIDGKLVITAREENHEGKDYTSARIMTKNTATFTYGKFEARIKLPSGQGIWPAFWMLGENIDSVRWPFCGEIDIMEMIGGQGRENTIHGTAHWADEEGKHTYIGNKITLAEGSFSDDFHVFAVTWGPEKIVWYMDGTPYHEQEISSDGMHAFHKPFYLLVNLAVGGNWPGYPDETTIFPQCLEVDYIRVYALKNGK